jgi:hypothetical protein
MKHASTRIRTEEPNFSDLPGNVHDWTYSVYGEVEELLPIGAPEPLGNYVTLLHYVDANLIHPKKALGIYSDQGETKVIADLEWRHSQHGW